jgi:glycine/serine hydroxymethyltransferase
MGPDEMRRVAEVIAALVRGDDPAQLRPTIAELCDAFPLP